MPLPVQLRRAWLLQKTAATALSQAAASAAAPFDQRVEISELRIYALREPVSKRAYTVLRIQTRAGLAGYGECGEVSAQEAARARAVLLGETRAGGPSRSRRWPVTASEVVDYQLAAAQTGGLRAAINMALLDLLGKVTGAPLYQVLGGPTRNKVRALATLENSGSDPEAVAAMKKAHAAGFRAFLVPAPRVPGPGGLQRRNQGKAFVQAVVRRIEALRKAGGGEADFVLDGESRLAPGDAASITAALESSHLLWLDEPCEAASLGAIRKLAAERVTPIGLGRTARQGGEFQDLLREEAVDVLRPSLAAHGISEIRKLAALAETYYVAVAPYHAGGPIATAAAIHLAASLPNFFIQQLPATEAEQDRSMRNELATGAEAVHDGFLALPGGPGLGISVNEKALEKYSDK